MQVDIVVPGYGRQYVRGESLDGSAPLVFGVADVLTGAECAAMIAKIEELGPSDAPITTSRGFVMAPDIRNNTRVMFDDPAFAAELYARLDDALPARMFGMRKHGVNERFRCYRYAQGQRFAPHYDGAFCRSAHEVSQLTLMVYLNDGFGGGTTKFYDHECEVAPRTGHALLFQHMQLHEGAVVTSGVKYVLRSDVMYRAAR